VIGGSGVITASTLVDFWTLSYIIPGVYYDASCDNCWPHWGNTPSAYGDLKFVTPTANAEQNSQFYFKDLSFVVDQAGRLNPGTPFDTITFTGTLNTNASAIAVVHSNNTGGADGRVVLGTVVPMLWGSDALIMQWGWINLLQAFSFASVASGTPILSCSHGFGTHFPGLTLLTWKCPAGNPYDCVHLGNCQLASPCAQPAASALSLVAFGPSGQCAPQMQPSSVIGTGTTQPGGNNETTAVLEVRGGLSAGAIAGITVGIIGLFIIVAVVGVLYFNHRDRAVKARTRQILEDGNKELAMTSVSTVL